MASWDRDEWRSACEVEDFRDEDDEGRAARYDDEPDPKVDAALREVDQAARALRRKAAKR